MGSADDTSFTNEDILATRPLSSHKRRRLSLESDDDPPILPSTSTPSTSADSECCAPDPQIKNSFILMDIPNIVKKTKEESTPLPDPFPLPKNFRPDVHLALTSKRMTKTTRATFFSTVAAAMFQYKRYPSRDDYVSVARQIVTKYPFLGSKGFGASHVSDKHTQQAIVACVSTISSFDLYNLQFWHVALMMTNKMHQFCARFMHCNHSTIYLWKI